MKRETSSTIGTSAPAIGIIVLAICLYCKCFQNEMSWVCKHTTPTTLPTDDTHIELQPMSNSMPEISTQLQSPQIVQEILKANGVDISKLEHYK